jgi:nucleoside-diphosphate-sugar epimerase
MRASRAVAGVGIARARTGWSMETPTLLVTGATGFIGRHVVAALQQRFFIHALSRRSPREARAPQSDNILWHQVDIADRPALEKTLRGIGADGKVDYVLHLAAYYDFTGEDAQEYDRTNVDGLRNVLELCRALKPKRFIFASSLAASQFPPRGTVLNERSPLDGLHPYAKSKRAGEHMLAEFRDDFPSVIVRLGAIYSDWCEFTPLFVFMGTWLSKSWKARILGGQGASALPFLHVRDCAGFFARVIEKESSLGQSEVLIAAPDEATSHRQMFDAATVAYFGQRPQPRLMPRTLAKVGMQANDFFGRLLGDRPFERPWMADYIDLTMPVDASYTRQRLGWAPNPRFSMVRRMPFLVENFKTDPIEWARRNLAQMKVVHVSNHLRLFQLIEEHEEELVRRSVAHCLEPHRREQFPTYHQLSREELTWAAQQTYLHLKNAVRTREKALFKTYAAEIASRRFKQGFNVDEVVDIIQVKHDTCVQVLLDDPRVRGLEDALHETVNMTFRLGIDQVQDTFDELGGEFVPQEPPG